MKLEMFRELAATFHPPFTEDSHILLQTWLQEMGVDPSNLYQELEMSYRFVQAHRDTSYSGSHISLHSHSFYELLCCRSSCGAEYLVGTQRYRLQKGDIIFVPPGVSHRPMLPEAMDEPYVRDVLWASAEFVEMLRRMFPFMDTPLPSHQNLLRTAGTHWESAGELLRLMVQESELRKPGWDAIVNGCAITLFAQLYRAFQTGETVRIVAEKPELPDRVMAYIEENLSRKISLADTARHFYVSSSTIGHLFQQKMGVSFYRCVTQRRLITAKQLIEARLPLETVAERTGFTDYSAFYRAFKQEYGISPRQYRSLQADTTSEGM